MNDSDRDEIKIDSNNKINGWIICRLKDEFESLQDISLSSKAFPNSEESVLNRVCDLLYGVISDDLYPPTDNWVFLASGKPLDYHDSLHKNLFFNLNFFVFSDSNLHSVAKFSEDLIQKVLAAPLKLELYRVKDESYKSQTEETFYRGYLINNSPIKELNGKFMEGGLFCGAPFYKHVRKWIIMRCRLAEIPELGITSDAAKSLHDSGAAAQKYFDKADKAFKEISTDYTNTIKDGSSEFSRRFIDIARAGTKMVTADQAIANVYNTNRRSELQSKASMHLLRQIARHGITSRPSTAPIPGEKASPTTSSSRADLSPVKEGAEELEKQQQEETDLDQEIPVENVDLQMIFTKNISYQQKNAFPQKLKNSETLWSAESELAAEVLTIVEERETLIEKLQAYVKEMEKIYLEEGENKESNYESLKDEGKEMLETILQEVRLKTIEFANAYGSWARLYMKAQREKDLFSLKVWEKDSNAYQKKYCVVIGFYSVQNLYGASQPVQSQSNRFFRPYESAVKATEMKYIGEFATEEEAAEAYYTAMRAFPQEQIHPKDLELDCKPLKSFRPCKKHYLLRSSTVSATLPCEQCVINDKLAEHQSQTKIYKDIENSFPVFLYKTFNYNQKIFSDLSFLKNYGVIRRFYSEEELQFTGNPLLLTEGYKRSLKESEFDSQTSSKKNGRDENNTSLLRKKKATDPLDHLKGKKEFLFDALQYSHHYRKEKKQKEKDSEGKDNPLWANQVALFKLPEVNPNDSLTTNIRKKQKIQENLLTNRFENTLSAPPAGSNNALSFSKSLPGPLCNSSNTSSFQFLKRYQQNEEEEKVKLLRSFKETLDTVPKDRVKLAMKILNQTRSDEENNGHDNEMDEEKSQVSSVYQPQQEQPHQPPSAVNNVLSTNIITPSSNQFDHMNLTISSSSPSLPLTSPDQAVAPLNNTNSLQNSTTATTAFSNNFSTLSYSKPMKNSLLQTTYHNHLKQDNKPTNKPINFIEVTTSYVDTAVDMKIVQKRYPPAYREDDVFCRTDIGEFAGFSKGRAVRAFDFKENLYRTGKEREEIRKDMQRRLREAVTIHITKCNVAFIEALIAEARTIRGSILNLDIIQAENFIKRYLATCRITLKAQCIYRGNKGRKLARSKKMAKIAFEKYCKTTEFEAVKLSQTFIPMILSKALENKKREKTQRPFYSAVINMSGYYSMVSIREGPRTIRKNGDSLCPVCLSEQFYEHEYTRIHKKVKERMPCSCPMLTDEENWLVRFYFPLTGETISKRFSLNEIRNILLDYEFKKYQYMSGSFLESVMDEKARLFDTIEPLFESILVEAARKKRKREAERREKEAENDFLFKDDLSSLANKVTSNLFSNSESTTTSINKKPRKGSTLVNYFPGNKSTVKVLGSYTQGWLQTAKESAVLPRLVTQAIPEKVKSILKSIRGKKKLFNIQTTTGPQTILNYHSVGNDDRNNNLVKYSTLQDENNMPLLQSDRINQNCWNWEPIHDNKQFQIILSQLQRNIAISQERKEQFSRDLQTKINDTLYYQQEIELASMILEDKLSKLADIAGRYQEQLIKNKEIMQFSRDLHDYIALLEKQAISDETRAYDYFEDGFQWQEMNQLVQLQKRWKKESHDLPMLTECQRVASQTLKELEGEIFNLSISHENARQDFDYFMNLYQEIEKEYFSQQFDLRKTMKLFLSLFSFPQKLIPTVGRYVAIFPYSLFLLRDPMERLRKENRNVMVGLLRRVVNLSSANSAMKNNQLDNNEKMDDKSQWVDNKNNLSDSNGRKSRPTTRQAAYALRQPSRENKKVVTKQRDELADLEETSSLYSYRSTVSIFFDELTGNIVINLSGSNIAIEEGSQHLDLALDQNAFSELTQHIQAGDIVITAEDIKLILTKAPNHYQNYSTEKEQRKRMTKRAEFLQRQATIKGIDLGNGSFILPSQRLRSVEHYRVIESHKNQQIDRKKFNPILLLGDPLQDDRQSVNEEKSEPIQNAETEENAVTDISEENNGKSPESKKEKKIRTYYKDYLLMEKKKTQFSERLLSYLKVQPHTSRPCLGLLHLIRRKNYAEKNFRKCFWFNDQKTLNPSFLTNEIYRQIISKTPSERVLVQVWHHLSRFEVSLQRITQGSTIISSNRIEIHTSAVLESFFSINQPFIPSTSSKLDPVWSSNLLGKGNLLFYFAFLQRIIVGNYSNFSTFNKSEETFHFPLMEHLTNRMIPRYNGVLTNHSHRLPFQFHEKSLFSFRKFSDELFQLSTNLLFYRFVCHYYCLLKLYFSSDDRFLKLEIHSPMDGRFYFHRYTGKIIKIYWTMDFVRCLLLKYNKLWLLRSWKESSLDEFIQFLVDSVEFIEEFAQQKAQQLKEFAKEERRLLKKRKQQQEEHELPIEGIETKDEEKDDDDEANGSRKKEKREEKSHLLEISDFFQENNDSIPTSKFSSSKSRIALNNNTSSFFGGGKGSLLPLLEDDHQPSGQQQTTPVMTANPRMKKILSINLEKFKDFVHLLVLKFNHWIEKRHSPKKERMSIGPEKFELLFNQIDALMSSPSDRPKWIFKEKKTSHLSSSMTDQEKSLDRKNAIKQSNDEHELITTKKGERIPIFNGLWTFHSLMNAPGEQQQQQSSSSSKGGGGSNDSFMGNVSLSMNKEHSNVYLVLTESSEEEKQKKFIHFFLSQERNAMQREDLDSSRFRDAIRQYQTNSEISFKNTQLLKENEKKFQCALEKRKSLIDLEGKQREERKRKLFQLASGVAVPNELQQKSILSFTSIAAESVDEGYFLRLQWIHGQLLSHLSVAVLDTIKQLLSVFFPGEMNEKLTNFLERTPSEEKELQEKIHNGYLSCYDEVLQLFSPSLFTNSHYNSSSFPPSPLHSYMESPSSPQSQNNSPLFRSRIDSHSDEVLSFLQTGISSLFSSSGSFAKSDSYQFFSEKISSPSSDKNTRRYLRTDILNYNFLQSQRKQPLPSEYRNSQLWFRNELVITKKNSQKNSSGKDCYLVDEDCHLYYQNTATERESIPPLEVCIEQLRISVFGIIEATLFSLTSNQYYRLWIIPSSSSSAEKEQKEVPSFPISLEIGLSQSYPSHLGATATPATVISKIITRIAFATVELTIIPNSFVNTMMKIKQEEIEEEKEKIRNARHPDDTSSNYVALNEEDSLFDQASLIQEDHQFSLPYQRHAQKATPLDANQLEKIENGNEELDNEYEGQGKTVKEVQPEFFEAVQEEDDEENKLLIDNQLLSVPKGRRSSAIFFSKTAASSRFSMTGTENRRKSSATFNHMLLFPQNSLISSSAPSVPSKLVGMLGVEGQEEEEDIQGGSQEIIPPSRMIQQQFSVATSRNSIDDTEIYLFHIPMDEASSVTVQHVPVTSLFAFINKSLGFEKSFFSEKSHAIYDKIILYQKKALIENCEKILLEANEIEEEGKEGHEEMANKLRYSIQQFINPRLKRLMPIITAANSVNNNQTSNNLDISPALLNISNASMSFAMISKVERHKSTSFLVPSSIGNTANVQLTTGRQTTASGGNSRPTTASIPSTTHPCYGDCVIMLRKKDDSLIQSLLSLFHTWEMEYLPALQLRKEKLGREKQWKIENQQKFASHVFTICDHLLHMTESFFLYHHRNNHSKYLPKDLAASLEYYQKNENTILLKFIRLLFRWFDFTRHEQNKEDLAPQGRDNYRRLHRENENRTDRCKQKKKNWKENMSKVDFPCLDPENEYLLEEFDCRIVDCSLRAVASSKSESAMHSLLSDSYFMYLFDILQRKQEATVSDEDNSLQIEPSSQTEETIVRYPPEDNQRLLCPSQVIYGVYFLHCSRCNEPLGECRFPHCHRIRAEWRSHCKFPLSTAAHSEKNSKDSIALLKHIVKSFLNEQTVQTSLLTEEQHHDLKTALTHDENKFLTLREDILEEKKRDVLAYQVYHHEKSLLFSFKIIEKQIYWLEFFSYYLLATTEMIRSQVSHQDLLAAKGGLFFQQLQNDREFFIQSSPEIIESFLPFLEITETAVKLSRVGRGTQKRSTRISMIRGAGSSSFSTVGGLRNSMISSQQVQQIVTKEISKHEWNISIPLKVIYEVLSIGYEFDPYPGTDKIMKYDSDKRISERQPLITHSFKQLMTQLRLSVYAEENPSRRLFDSGRFLGRSSLTNPIQEGVEETTTEEEKRIVSFDRLLTEGILLYHDNSMLILQYFYGILSGKDLLLSEDLSNIPPAGLRFLPLEEVTKAERGITLLIYDNKSEISRAIYITERQIEKYAERKGLSFPRFALGSNKDGEQKYNYKSIAKLFLQESSQIIEIHRSENYFLSIQLHLAIDFMTNEEKKEYGVRPPLTPSNLKAFDYQDEPKNKDTSKDQEEQITIEELTTSSCRIDARNYQRNLVSLLLAK
jgi:hypothetical protein